MKKVFSYVKPYTFFAVMSILMMAGEVVIDLFLPSMMSRIVDDGIVQSNMSIIIETGIKMIVLVVIGGLTGLSAAFFSSYASQSFGRDLRRDTYQKVMSLSIEQTDKFTTGSLVTRMTNDVTMCQDLVAMVVRMFIRAPILFVGSIIMSLSISLKFGIVILIALPLELLAVFLFIRKASPLYTKVQKRLDKVNSVVEENVNGTRVVKAFVREEHEQGRFGEANKNLADTSLKVALLLSKLAPIMMIMLNIAVVAIIYVGGVEVNVYGSLQVGQIMAAITYITQTLFSLMMVSIMFQSISRGSASAKRIAEVLETEPVINSGSSTTDNHEGTVRYENVSFRYPGTHGDPVLNGINLEINKGEYVAVLGATASGKSSLVNLIPRFYDAVDGNVYVDGQNVRDYNLDDLRSRMSCILQKSELFAGTVSDNIRFGCPDASDEDVLWAAKIAQADEFITGFKDGYDTWIDEKGTSLSGGQKQRISIARAIIRRPEILIFDDSTSALDLGTEARLRTALKQELQGTTIIMIAQRVASVMQADRIAVLENGEICACGTHKELLETSTAYQDIYHSQMKGGEPV